MMQRVKVEVHPRAEELITNRVKEGILPTFWDVIVELVAKGKKFTAEVSTIKGSASDPLTDDELNKKFRENAAFSILPVDNIELFIHAIYNLEEIDNVSKLMKLVSVTQNPVQ